MAIVVNTNSYVSEAEFTAFALDRGVTITRDMSILLIKAMDILESRPFKGEKVDNLQSLQFPRINVSEKYDLIIPDEIKKSQMFFAISIGEGAEYNEVDSLASFGSVQLGPIKVDTKQSKQQFPPIVTYLLRPFIGSTFNLVRG